DCAGPSAGLFRGAPDDDPGAGAAPARRALRRRPPLRWRGPRARHGGREPGCELGRGLPLSRSGAGPDSLVRSMALDLISVDGRISAAAEAVIPVKDDGLYRGDGAFEVIRLYRGRPFALADHLDRL